jgi:AcrR family transcriptional regulator
LGAKGEATRQRLMDAAEEIFGTKGFYNTSVGEIAAKAGVAQGTFYLYFPSKIDIFKALVEHLSHVLRQKTEIATQGAKDRLEAERLGIETFYRFVDRHRNLYRIVRQAEFVDEDLYKWYYKRMARGYAQKLAEAMARGEIRQMDPELAAWCLMGISDYTGMRYILWEDANHAEPATLLEFIASGLTPEKG